MGLLVSVHFAGETEFKLFSKSFEPFSKGSAGETGLKLFPKSFEPFLEGLGPFFKGSCFAFVPFSKGFLWCSPFPKALVLLWWLGCPFPKAFCGAALFQRHGMAQVFSKTFWRLPFPKLLPFKFQGKPPLPQQSH